MMQIIFDIIIIILWTIYTVLNFIEGNVFSAILNIFCIICWIICLILHIKNGMYYMKIVLVMTIFSINMCCMWIFG